MGCCRHPGEGTTEIVIPGERKTRPRHESSLFSNGSEPLELPLPESSCPCRLQSRELRSASRIPEPDLDFSWDGVIG
jgi:hypothetical protein